MGILELKILFIMIRDHRRILATAAISLMIAALSPVLSWATVKVTGVVKNAETGAPLSCAHVQIAGTNWMAAADDAGRFCFENIPAGAYRVTATYIGFARGDLPLDLTQAGTSWLEFELQPLALALPEVTVTGAAIDQRVYDREKIRETSAENLAVFLERAGEATILDGGGSKAARITIRGAKPEQVGIYLDGHRLNDPLMGEFDLKSIPVSSLERIVVKSNPDLTGSGPGAGGAVELYTAENPGNNVEILRGSLDTYRYSLGLGRGYGAHRFNFSYTREGSDGDFQYEHECVTKRRINDDHLSGNLYLKYRLQSGGVNFSAAYHHLNSGRGAPGGVENPATLDRIETSTDGFALSFKAAGSRWMSDNRFSRFETKTGNFTHYFWAGDTLEYRSSHRATAMEVESSIARMDSLGQSALGASYRVDGVSSSALRNIEERRNFGMYISRTASFRKVRLSSVIRGDNYRKFGDVVSASLAGRVESLLLEGLALSGNWSRSFSLPTFNQLFWAENVFSEPNPDLQPERMESWDAGIEWRSDFMRAGAVYFDRRIEKLIIWRETYTQSGKKWKPVNTDAARIKGVEFRFGLKWRRISFDGNAAFSDPRNRGSDYYGKYLTFRPQVQTSETASIEIHHLELSVSHRYLSRRYILEANTKWEDPASVFDFSFKISRRLQGVYGEIRLRVLNAFGQRYSIIKESPLPGRRYSLSLTVEFD